MVFLKVFNPSYQKNYAAEHKERDNREERHVSFLSLFTLSEVRHKLQ